MLDAEAAQVSTLFLVTGGRKDLGTNALGQLDGGKADAASGDVDQDALALLQARHVVEAVVNSRERGWNRSGTLKRDMIRHLRKRSRGQLDEALQAAAVVAHDAVAGLDIGDASANRNNHCAILEAKVAVGSIGLGFGRQQASYGHDVAEVEAHGLDLQQRFAIADDRHVGFAQFNCIDNTGCLHGDDVVGLGIGGWYDD